MKNHTHAGQRGKRTKPRFNRMIVAHLRAMWVQLTCKIPEDTDTTTEARWREVERRL